jgi:hypothetical protein
MTVHDAVQGLLSMGGVTIVLLSRGRLRMNSPKVRIALGGAGIVLATFVFYAVMRFLPRPYESGFSPFVDVATLAACFFIGGLLVLSLIEVSGGTLQAVKRWRYYRRSAS